MKKLSSTFAQFATLSFFIQVLLLLIVSATMHFFEQKKNQELSISTVTNISQQSKEDIILQTITGNDRARDFILYEILQNKHLNSIEFISLKEIKKKISRTPKNCNIIENVCSWEAKSEIVGSIPLITDHETIGVLIQKSHKDAKEDMIGNFFWTLLATLLVGLLTSSLVTFILFRRVFAGDVQALHALVKNIGNRETHLRRRTLSIQELNETYKTINKTFEQLLFLESLETERKIAKQVAHDIRSPLTALDMALHDISHFPEEKRVLIRKASQRIHDIANNLLSQSQKEHANEDNTKRSLAEQLDQSEKLKSNNSKTSTQLISSLIDPIISEKRMQFRTQMDLEIESVIRPESYGLFAEINPIELSRVLSNLINNSEEAISSKLSQPNSNDKSTGLITIGLTRHGEDRLRLYVKDNGCGMDSNILNSIGKKGFSSGKSVGTGENKSNSIQSGSGLGVYHARKTIEAWDGELEIQSQPGLGSTFSILLPLAEPPQWFVSQIKASKGAQVVILDDDASIHQTWMERFKESTTEKALELIHFSTPEGLRQWRSENTESEALLLCDHEILGYEETGVDLITDLHMERQSILVTSRSSEGDLLDLCESHGIKCLPKELAGIIPVNITT